MEDSDFDFDSDDELQRPEVPAVAGGKKMYESVTKINVFATDQDTNLVRTDLLESSPGIVHFAGIQPSNEYVQTINIINRSSVSQRFRIIPPTSPHFRIECDKKGKLAPGMAQKIHVIFSPPDYKYYSDFIRIRSEGKSLLIPLHGYPYLASIDFPKQLSFGKAPLFEPQTKTISLKCNIPINFSFDIEIPKPHPYFEVFPLSGEIPANGSVDLSVRFNPYTLGTCVITLRLRIGQYNFTPLECLVTARAVSGLIESKEVDRLNSRILDKIAELEKTVQAMSLEQTKPSDKVRESVSVLLASTFKSHNSAKVLNGVMSNTTLLSSKVPIKQGNILSLRADGTLKNTEIVRPVGPGSGAVFDAGSEWITKNISSKTFKKTQLPASTSAEDPMNSRVVEGLRIPSNLNIVTNVNFVLTQEAGKLKPKDLKAAIEKNRAEKEARNEEQRKIKEAAGGTNDGTLDLRAILNEESMGVSSGNSFDRQLREMAFLDIVADVEKLDIEKGIRVSEEFIGADPLLESDVRVIKLNRIHMKIHKLKNDWRDRLSRQMTSHIPSYHASIKAGAPCEVSSKIIAKYRPKFDSNTNDVWSKRLNTLRRFISLVSRWMIQKRISRRLKRVAKFFADHGISTKDQARDFIEKENQNSVNKSNSKAVATKSASSLLNNKLDAKLIKTVGDLVCTLDNPAVVRRKAYDLATVSVLFQPRADMFRRNLFPKFVLEKSAERAQLESDSIQNALKFEDKTLFPFVTRPEYIVMNYVELKVPPTPYYFPSAPSADPKNGAFEEMILRPASDRKVSSKEATAAAKLPPCLANLFQESEQVLNDQSFVCTWSSAAPTFTQSSVDHFQVKPDYRVYMQSAKYSEIQDSWIFRPISEFLCYDEDFSIRSCWLRESGFLGTNLYSFQGAESRKIDGPTECGPMLSDIFNPDTDRHSSGLNCFHLDHLRSLTEFDAEAAQLQSKLDSGDVLTDSESDDETNYQQTAPSIMKIKEILKTPVPVDVPVETAQPKGNAKGKGKDAKPAAKPAPAAPAAKAAPPPAATAPMSAVTSSATSAEEAGDANGASIKENQVELLRDRKVLELETQLRKEKYAKFDKVSSRLVELTKSFQCTLYAPSVQIPFHQYETAVLELQRLQADSALAEAR